MADTESTPKTEIPHPAMSEQRKRWLFKMTAIFLLLGLIFLIYWLFIGQYYEDTDDAYVNGNLVQVMPQTPGYVTTIFADETNLVKKGQIVVKLDKADADIALKDAEAKLALTARHVGQLYNNVEQLKANIELQKNHLEKARDDYQRRKGLVVNKTISEEDLQHAQLAVEGANYSLVLAKRQFDAAVNLVEHTDLYNHPQLKQAAQSFRTAYLASERTTIYAPETGFVAKRTVQVGQQVITNSALMIIVPLDQIWVDANFKETQLENIRIGQPVTLVSDLYGNRVTYQGKIVGLSAGTGSAFDLLPPQNATGNWIKIVQRVPVRIAIDAKQLEKHPLQIGLSMSVSVDTSNRNGEVLTKVPHNKILYQTRDYTSELQKANQRISEIIRSNVKNATYTPPPHELTETSKSIKTAEPTQANIPTRKP
jgi:membrane fusion protein (multidrug efflux system)